MEYIDLSIRVQDDGDVLASSDLGESYGRLNLNQDDIRPILQAIDEEFTREELLKRLGRILFDALFDKNISNQFSAVKAEAEHMGRGVRLRLIFEKPEIAALPWEFLFDESTNTFLANDPKTALSRYIDVPLKKQDIKPATLPLKMLLVVSSPSDLDPLDSEGEEKLIRKALEKHIGSGLIEIDTIAKATIDAIYQRMNEKAYNVFHFIGHGVFENNKGHIALVDEDGRARLLDDEAFANLFLGKRGLGLVLLNSCEGAMTSSGQAFRGMAPRLVQRGIPAVIAMQYTILDSTAKTFAEEFYRSLSRGDPVDRAVQSARNLISIKTKLDNRDFATPVLFMRARDGIVLDLHEAPGPSLPPKPEKPAEIKEDVREEGKEDLKENRRDIEKATIPFYRRYEKLILAALLMIVMASALFYFLAPDNVQISGTVKDWNGVALQNANVNALPADISIRTDSNGYFILPNIPAKDVDRLQIRKEKTNELIEVPVSDDKKKDKSIIFDNIVFKPASIRLYGDIRDYSGGPYGAKVRIAIKYENNYLANLTDIEYGRYDTNIYSNATNILVYDIHGNTIYSSTLKVTPLEIAAGEKKFPIQIPSKTEINIDGTVKTIPDSKPLANTTVNIGDTKNKTNDTGQFYLYGVPRSSQYYQVSRDDKVIFAKNLSDYYKDWTNPDYIYRINDTLWIRIPDDEL